jgi:VWFA-related protein
MRHRHVVRKPFAAIVVAASLAAVLSARQAAPPGQGSAEPASTPDQGGEQRPVFRGGATFVRVDAYPRRDGQVVTGLTADDFEVFEDGKPQRVETFEFIRFEPNTPDTERRDPNTFADSERQAADPRNRVFVVFLDIFHLSFESVNRVRTPVLDFLDRAVGPTDLFAAMTPEIPVSRMVFGRRTETIATELLKLWQMLQFGRQVSPRTPMEEQLWACGSDTLVRLHREDLLYTTLENLVVRLGALKDERKNVLFISEGFVPRPGGQYAIGGGFGGIPIVGTGPTGRLGIGNQQPYRRDGNFCEQQISRLTGMDFEDRFRQLLREAERSNVSFYPIDVGGLNVNLAFADASIRTLGEASRRDSERFGQRAIDILRTLADNTDGLAVVNTNDITRGVRRIADSLSGHYILGYYSSNTVADGRYRQIRVRVKRSGISVSARPGYYGLTPALAERASSPPEVKPPSAVDVEIGRLARVRDDAELLGFAAPGPAGFTVVVEVASRLQALGRWTDGGDLHVSVAKGSDPVGSATGRLEPGRRAAVVEVPVGDLGSAAAYRVLARLTGRDGVLEEQFDVSVPPPSAIGAPRVFRALASPRAPLHPVADLRFRRTERLRAEWPALESLGDSKGRVLDRNGQPLPITPIVGQREEAGRYLLTLDLPLASFPEGDFVIELTPAGADEADRRLLAFRVVR